MEFFPWIAALPVRADPFSIPHQVRRTEQANANITFKDTRIPPLGTAAHTWRVNKNQLLGLLTPAALGDDPFAVNPLRRTYGILVRAAAQLIPIHRNEGDVGHLVLKPADFHVLYVTLISENSLIKFSITPRG